MSLGMRMDQRLSVDILSVINPGFIHRLIWKGIITSHKFLNWLSVLSYWTGWCRDNLFNLNLWVAWFDAPPSLRATWLFLFFRASYRHSINLTVKHTLVTWWMRIARP